MFPVDMSDAPAMTAEHKHNIGVWPSSKRRMVHVTEVAITVANADKRFADEGSKQFYEIAPTILGFSGFAQPQDALFLTQDAGRQHVIDHRGQVGFIGITKCGYTVELIAPVLVAYASVLKRERHDLLREYMKWRCRRTNVLNVPRTPQTDKRRRLDQALGCSSQ